MTSLNVRRSYLDKELVEEEANYDEQAWMLHALAIYSGSANAPARNAQGFWWDRGRLARNVSAPSHKSPLNSSPKPLAISSPIAIGLMPTRARCSPCPRITLVMLTKRRRWLRTLKTA